MALKETFEKQGGILFRYRGQIPSVLFLLAIPVIFTTNYSLINLTLMRITQLSGILLSIAGLCFRAFTIATTPCGTSGRNTDKQYAESLNSTGIYSIVRHPLYFGNYLMWIGIVFFTVNFYFIVVVSLAYWIYYERIMFTEECYIERQFGEAFKNWSAKVPAFFPALTGYKSATTSFSFKSILRREYSGWLATVVGFFFVDVLRKYFNNRTYDILKEPMFFVLCGFIVLTLLLKSLKRLTNVLKEEDRS